MIAQVKYCEIILNDPQLLGELVKKTGKQYRLQTLELALKRRSPSILRNIGLIETLRDSGLKDEEIFEQEDKRETYDTV